MAYGFTEDDARYLASGAADAALAAASGFALTPASLIGDLTRLKALAGDHHGAVAETAMLRRKAHSRWGSGGGVDWSAWLFTDEALQQAAPPPVAAHRARRVAGAALAAGLRAVHDLTCSVGADLVALAAADADRPVLGSDLDPVRLLMAAHNVASAGSNAMLLRADARTVSRRGTLRYADPARRDSAGRRITSADTIPSVAELDAADPANPPVLRLPPGIDYGTLARPGEIEIVSWRGAVREAVSWPEPFAAATRRATVLAGDGSIGEQFTDLDEPETDVIPARRFLIDPDPAIVRAHLVQQYAARHALGRLDEHLAYLTGDAAPEGRRAFEILDSAPYSEKTVRGWVRRDAVGSLEIKQRGTPLNPDELRRRVKPTGDRHVDRTLIVARIGRSPRAFWCRATTPGGGRPTVG